MDIIKKNHVLSENFIFMNYLLWYQNLIIQNRGDIIVFIDIINLILNNLKKI